MKRDTLRRCIFRPYCKGAGPHFYLVTWRLGNRVGYQLTQVDGERRTPLFEGDDFRPSLLHAIDSDESITALMGFLTLRPGDTDDEYFVGYTPTQLQYCNQHAEALSAYCSGRFEGVQ